MATPALFDPRVSDDQLAQASGHKARLCIGCHQDLEIGTVHEHDRDDGPPAWVHDGCCGVAGHPGAAKRTTKVPPPPRVLP